MRMWAALASTPPIVFNAPMREWLRQCCEGHVIRRGLKYSLVVGAILIAINYGDVIMRGELRPSHYLKMLLTVTVPFVVSVLSSVGALRRARRQD